jgi:hypothetical protein
MSMVVKGWDLFNLRQQSLVNLLNVRAGKRARLGGGETGKAHRDIEKDNKLLHKHIL